ncbi:MAG: hypothetical protein Fur0022_03900 [Anaerolineales bacterium]
MAYRLEAHETVSMGTRRVLLERVQEALDDLTNPEKDRNKGVHDARKNLKRLRAALRLIRGEIGEEAYLQENVDFRDAARLIASARDSWVMVETLDRLAIEYQEYLAPGAFAGVRQTLVNQYETVKQRALESEDTIPAVVNILRSAHARLENLPIQRENFAVFRAGLHKIYTQGQTAMTLAYTHPSPEAFHEWRKRVKYLWYQIEILALLWPNMLENLAEELHTLSEYLGEDHDLAVLRRVVLDDPDGFADEKELLLFISLIDQKRLRLQASAHPLGERIYFDPPKIFVARLEQYWKAWRAEDEARQAHLIEEIQKVSPPSLHSVEGLFTTREMAARLEVSIAKVRDLIHAQKLPAEKVGPVWVIKVGDPTQEISALPHHDEDNFWSVRETADYLNIPPAKVRKLIYSSQLPATKVGRNWVIKESEAQSLLQNETPEFKT